MANSTHCQRLRPGKFLSQIVTAWKHPVNLVVVFICGYKATLARVFMSVS
jgi:hypothetical protein